MMQTERSRFSPFRMVRPRAIGGQIATLLVEQRGEDYYWSLDLASSIVDGTAASLDAAMREVAEAAREADAVPSRLGKLFAARSRDGGSVLELYKDRWIDLGIWFPSLSEAEEYVESAQPSEGGLVCSCGFCRRRREAKAA